MPKLERFEITDQSGPDVLLVRGALVDVVSHVPEEPIDGADIYLDTVGEATLLIEMGRRIRDVQTFPSAEKLVQQLQLDVQQVREWAGTKSKS